MEVCTALLNNEIAKKWRATGVGGARYALKSEVMLNVLNSLVLPKKGMWVKRKKKKDKLAVFSKEVKYVRQ